MGFFVRDVGGVLKRVVWVGRKGIEEAGVCDWEGKKR
jgi:preprotein translocase subunit SecE